MKRIIVLIIAGLLVASVSQARDFIVEFEEENYKETEVAYSHTPMIYHSIQVTSDAGPKLLILSGEDLEYRRWLRQYIAQDKSFMVKVPDTENDLFISSKAFEIDVTLVHPFSGEKWAPGEMGKSRKKTTKSTTGVRMLHGDRHILILDTNTKRSRLITSVVNRMGYTAMVSHDGEQALGTFKNQPEKFKLIIANHQMPGMPVEDFVNRLLKVDHQIPVIVETGYNNPKNKKYYISKFSGAGSVTVTPVVLDDLQNTIKQLVKTKPAQSAEPGTTARPPEKAKG
jgi:CheY-like chemotaxis protein